MKTLLPWTMIVGLSFGSAVGNGFFKLSEEPTNKAVLFGVLCGVVCFVLCSMFRGVEWLVKKWRSPLTN